MFKEFSISILDCNILNLKDTLSEISTIPNTSLHLDIIDSTFCNKDNISFGPVIVNTILSSFEGECDLHLMVEDPKKLLNSFNLNSVRDTYTHKVGCENLTLNPGDPVPPSLSGNVLLMCVEAGKGGQKFNPLSISYEEKIRKAREAGAKKVGVDGGISPTTIREVADADFFIVGSAYHKSESKSDFIKTLSHLVM